MDPKTQTAAPAGGAPTSPSSAFTDLSPEVRAGLPERRPEALQAFYDAYFDRLYGYVRRLVREEHLAEDLTQEIFLHLYQNFASYDPTRALRPWVFTIATNKVRDHWRSRKHQMALRESTLDPEERGPTADASAPRPEARLEASETSEAIARAVEALPDSMRGTLIMRYYEGLSFEEIGAIIDRNQAAVRKRYSRALEELRKLLSETLGPAADAEAEA